LLPGTTPKQLVALRGPNAVSGEVAVGRLVVLGAAWVICQELVVQGAAWATFAAAAKTATVTRVRIDVMFLARVVVGWR
jgi:hypothetical protein